MNLLNLILIGIIPAGILLVLLVWFLYHQVSRATPVESPIQINPADVQKRDVVINEPLNRMHGICRTFGLINSLLPEGGTLTVHYEHLNPDGDDDFPHYRVLTRTEVIGRLYYCGFKVVGEDNVPPAAGWGRQAIKQAALSTPATPFPISTIKAVKAYTPLTTERRHYGALIKLIRIGYHGKPVRIYKFRTMYPYSEFAQEYIYSQQGLQDGGKFRDDPRITRRGRFMRATFLDEIPMFYNLLRGDIKLVGVRPISEHYFSLYSPELREKRIQHRPGLMPPFYADMPTSLEEIQASEMRYLTACEQHGTFRTDFRYFFRILYSITFGKHHSH